MTLGKYLVECMMIAVHEQLAGSVTVFFHKILIIWSTDYFWYNPLLMTEIFLSGLNGKLMQKSQRSQSVLVRHIFFTIKAHENIEKQEHYQRLPTIARFQIILRYQDGCEVITQHNNSGPSK